MPPPNAIFLDTETAELFKQFCRLEAEISKLIASGVFDVRNGAVTLYFDKHGVIVNIKANVDLYSSRT